MDERRLRGAIDLPSQRADEDVDGVVLDVARMSPHPFDEGVPGEHLPGAPHQKLKELKFPQRELDLATPAHHLMGGGVERQVRYAQRRSARHGSPSRENTDPRKKLGE